jgi:hypothetical protein
LDWPQTLNPPASTSQVDETTGMCQYARLRSCFLSHSKQLYISMPLFMTSCGLCWLYLVSTVYAGWNQETQQGSKSTSKSLIHEAKMTALLSNDIKMTQNTFLIFQNFLFFTLALSKLLINHESNLKNH